MNKGIIALFFVVIALVGLTFFIDDKEEVTHESMLFLPKLEKNINDVISIDINAAGGEHLTIYRDDVGWKLEQKSNYGVDFSQVRKLLIELSELTVLAEKTKKLENYAKLGVEDVASDGASSKQIIVYGKDNVELAAIIVGDQKNQGLGKQSLFVRHVNDPQVWQVEGSVTLAPLALDWLDREIVDVGKEQVAMVEIIHPDGSVIKISRVEKENRFSLDGLAEHQALISEHSLDNVANGLSGLRFDHVIKKSDFEFDKSAVVSAKFSLTSSEVLNISSVEADEKFFIWIDISVNDTSLEKSLVKLAQDIETWVFEVPKHKAENLRMLQSSLVKEK